MTIALISHPACLGHRMGHGHPECPERLTAINDQIIASGLDAALRHYDAPRVAREALSRVHAPEYVDAVYAAAPEEGLVWLDPDTAMGPGTLEAAERAAGAQTLAVDLVLGGEATSAFCLVRPPGHHAERARAMGFCFFNNIAVGAAHALAAHGLSRVAIVDFDVHHGNGTEQIFSGDRRVLFCSTFQHPFYPYSGADSTADNVVNVPLPGGSASAAFRAAVMDQWLPALESFAPELILISAGFDAHLEDDMAGLALREPDYAWVTKELRKLAERFAGGRIVSTLEGGYALSALGRSVVSHLRALLG